MMHTYTANIKSCFRDTNKKMVFLEFFFTQSKKSPTSSQTMQHKWAVTIPDMCIKLVLHFQEKNHGGLHFLTGSIPCPPPSPPRATWIMNLNKRTKKGLRTEICLSPPDVSESCRTEELYEKPGIC